MQVGMWPPATNFDLINEFRHPNDSFKHPQHDKNAKDWPLVPTSVEKIWPAAPIRLGQCRSPSTMRCAMWPPATNFDLTNEFRHPNDSSKHPQHDKNAKDWPLVPTAVEKICPADPIRLGQVQKPKYNATRDVISNDQFWPDKRVKTSKWQL